MSWSINWTGKASRVAEKVQEQVTYEGNEHNAKQFLAAKALILAELEACGDRPVKLEAYGHADETCRSLSINLQPAGNLAE